MRVALANAKATHIFLNINISIYVILNYQSFNDALTKTSLVLNNWIQMFERKWWYSGIGKQQTQLAFFINL